MSTALASRCLDMASHSGVGTVLLIGGEPLLHPDLRGIIGLAHERGMRVVIVSNGLALHDSPFADEVLNPLSEADELGISVKGFDNRQYLDGCGIDGGFDMLKEAVSNIEEAGVSYSLSFVISESSLESFAKCFQLFYEEFQAPIGLSFCSPCFSGEEIEGRTAPKEHAGLVSRTLSMLSCLKPGLASCHVNAPLCLVDQACVDGAHGSASLITGCHVLNRSGVVFDTNGDTLLCNHLTDLPIGIIDRDYSDPEGFAAFLSSAKYENAWSAFTRLPYKQCSSCEQLLTCGGGCPLLYY